MTLAIYRIPHQRYHGHSVYTNTTSCGAMRGFGNPQGNYAMEQTVDLMAEKLGMDPLELRRKNIGHLPRTAGGFPDEPRAR